MHVILILYIHVHYMNCHSITQPKCLGVRPMAQSSGTFTSSQESKAMAEHSEGGCFKGDDYRKTIGKWWFNSGLIVVKNSG